MMRTVLKKTKCLLSVVLLLLLLTSCSHQAQKMPTHQTQETSAGQVQEPLTWQEQYDLGMRYLTEGKYTEAVVAFTAAAEIDPKQADAFAKRGEANAKLAEAIDGAQRETYCKNALEDYEKAKRLGFPEDECVKAESEIYFRLGETEQGFALIEDSYGAENSASREMFLASVGTQVYDIPDSAYGFVHGRIADIDGDDKAEYVALYSTRDGLEIRVVQAREDGTLSENRAGIIGRLGYCNCIDVVLFFSTELNSWCIEVEDIPEGAYTGVNGFTSSLYLLDDSGLTLWKTWDWNSFIGYWDELDGIWAEMTNVGWPSSRYEHMVPIGAYSSIGAFNRSGNNGAAWLLRTDIELEGWNEWGTNAAELTRYAGLATRDQLRQLGKNFGPFEVYPLKKAPNQTGNAGNANDASAGNVNALSQIIYLGEHSNCRMPRETALAYASIVADWPAESEWFGPSGAALVDAGQDGYPLLLVGNSYYEREIGGLCGSGRLYEYRNGAATQMPQPYSYAIGELNGRPAVLAYDMTTGAVEFPYHYQFYTVSNGRAEPATEVVFESQDTTLVNGVRRHGSVGSWDAYLASLGWIEQERIGPDYDTDEMSVSFTSARDFIDALLDYADASSDERGAIEAKLRGQEPRSSAATEKPAGVAAYLGMTIGEIRSILGSSYEAYWYEGPAAFFADALPGVLLAGDWNQWVEDGTINGFRDEDVVSGIIVFGDVDLYGGLHTDMTYQELCDALRGIAELDQPWRSEFDEYFLHFEYGAYAFNFVWNGDDDPNVSTPREVWINRIGN